MANKKVRRREEKAKARQPAKKAAPRKAAPKHAKTEEPEGRRTDDG